MGGGLSALGSALVLDDGAAAAAQEDYYADVAEGEQRAWLGLGLGVGLGLGLG